MIRNQTQKGTAALYYVLMLARSGSQHPFHDAGFLRRLAGLTSDSFREYPRMLLHPTQGQHVGLLEQLTEVPLDVLFEVCIRAPLT